MPDVVLPPFATLAEFAVGSPVFIAETKIATVWRVEMRDGRFAALKVYHGDDMAGERYGFDLAERLGGAGVAEVYGRTARAALLEWLQGPSLGDLVRDGRDREAAMELVAVAHRIHATRLPPWLALPHLQDWFRALFDLKFDPDHPAGLSNDITRCKAMAQQLLATQQDVRPLHGDLHHDNIRHGARGYCAFDAKGVLGEPTYELANAFRNPVGADAIMRDPARVRFLRNCWSQAFAVDAGRLMAWTAVKCALSIAWRSGPVLQGDAEADLLHLFLRIADEI
jgi:streptomycin 6-kinase